MKIIRQSILKKLNKPLPDSHKGQNGRILIIAGSDKFHGALLLSVQSASRIVDMVYVYSTSENLKLVNKLKSKISTFIGVKKSEFWNTVKLVDAILIGPGLSETKENIKLLQNLLKKYPNKKIMIDATAAWHVDPNWLHSNCIVTPHSREFENIFKCKAKAKNVLKMAKKYNCVVTLKGRYDYISDGKNLWENRTGNVGMTKGGTGDVLSALVCSFSAKNDNVVATLAGIYLNGLVGDNLYKKVGVFYNAEDLIEVLGRIWKKLL